MGSTCIFTDHAAQLIKKSSILPKNFGYLPYSIDLGYQILSINDLSIDQLPDWLTIGKSPPLLTPSESDFGAAIGEYRSLYDDLFVILTSSNLFPAFQVAEAYSRKHHGRAKLRIIDSQTVSVGEGILVQKTIEMIQKNLPADAIEESLRQTVPHIFTLLSTTNFSYLQNYGFLDRGQAIAGEMLSVYPILSLDNGKLNPLDKIKNIRGVIDYYIEFIDEFDELESVSIIHPYKNHISEFRLIQQYLEDQHPGTRFSEVSINPFMAALLGPKGMGIILQEKID